MAIKVCKKCGRLLSKRYVINLCRSCILLGNTRMLGHKHSCDTKEKMKIAKLGKENPNWKGYDYKFKYTAALHQWIRRNWKNPPTICERCHKNFSFDLANKGIYNRDFKNWEWLCRRCHMNSDKRINNLKQYAQGKS